MTTDEELRGALLSLAGPVEWRGVWEEIAGVAERRRRRRRVVRAASTVAAAAAVLVLAVTCAPKLMDALRPVPALIITDEEFPGEAAQPSDSARAPADSGRLDISLSGLTAYDLNFTRLWERILAETGLAGEGAGLEDFDVSFNRADGFTHILLEAQTKDGYSVTAGGSPPYEKLSVSWQKLPEFTPHAPVVYADAVFAALDSVGLAKLRDTLLETREPVPAEGHYAFALAYQHAWEGDSIPAGAPAILCEHGELTTLAPDDERRQVQDGTVVLSGTIMEKVGGPDEPAAGSSTTLMYQSTDFVFFVFPARSWEEANQLPTPEQEAWLDALVSRWEDKGIRVLDVTTVSPIAGDNQLAREEVEKTGLDPESVLPLVCLFVAESDMELPDSVFHYHDIEHQALHMVEQGIPLRILAVFSVDEDGVEELRSMGLMADRPADAELSRPQKLPLQETQTAIEAEVGTACLELGATLDILEVKDEDDGRHVSIYAFVRSESRELVGPLFDRPQSALWNLNQEDARISVLKVSLDESNGEALLRGVKDYRFHRTSYWIEPTLRRNEDALPDDRSLR